MAELCDNNEVNVFQFCADNALMAELCDNNEVRAEHCNNNTLMAELCDNNEMSVLNYMMINAVGNRL